MNVEKRVTMNLNTTVIREKKPQKPFPFNFSTKFPLMTYQVINLSQFVNMEFKNVEYIFDETTENQALYGGVLRNMLKQQKVNINLIREIAFHLISINTLSKCTENELFKNHFVHVIGHLISIEELLPKERSLSLDLITQAESREIVLQVRLKVWNYLLFFDVTPIILEQIFYITVSYKKVDISLEKDEKNEFRIIVQKLEQKSQRFLKYYSEYFYRIIQRRANFSIKDYIKDFPQDILKTCIKDKEKTKEKS